MTAQAEQTILEHYILGEVYSRKAGAQCLPAIERSTGNRCILKIYEIPKDKTVTDALLLCRAYQSRDDVNRYYKSLGLELLRQAALMNALSSGGGFSHYINCQMSQTEDNGYQIHLLSPFVKTLADQFKKELLSHKEIIRLGCDLCQSLEKSRQAGFLYVGLKPENIFCTADGYIIGDLGFIPLSSLPYRSMPQSCCNTYTPGSSHDCFAQIPENCDVYSLGKVLLQAYCGGHLPENEVKEDSPLLKIIQKACSLTAFPTPGSFAQALSMCSLS